MLRNIKTSFEKLFFYDKWNIGHTVLNAEDFISEKGIRRNITWLEEDNVEYRADPFAFIISGKLYLILEELRFIKGKGVLRVIEDFDKNHVSTVNGLKWKRGHVSYPFVFKHTDRLYCIPETSDKNRVDLYEIDPYNMHDLKWVRTLIYGAKYVDSSIFYYDNKFWLFTSKAQEYGRLYVFWANSLEEFFISHSQNPIRTQINQSRGAGSPFFADGHLYIPTQNPKRCYGGSITINIIKTLTTTDIVIEEYFEVLPIAPYYEGIHTINFADGRVIIDGKRKILSVFAAFKKVCKRIRGI